MSLAVYAILFVILGGILWVCFCTFFLQDYIYNILKMLGRQGYILLIYVL